MNIFSKLTLAAGLMALFAACSSSTTPPATGNNTVVPQKGSTYSYHTVTKDSNNVAKDSSNRFDTVLATGLTYQGKTNVSEVQSTTLHLARGTTSMDTTYFNYESNGDISVFQNASPALPGSIPLPAIAAGWLTIGVSSGTPTNLVLFDTTFTYNGANGEGKATVTASKGVAGSEMVNGQTLSGNYITEVNSVQAFTTVPVIGTKFNLLSSDETNNILFLPTIGNFGDRMTTSTTKGSVVFPYSNSKSTSVETLTGFTLK